MKKYIVTTNEDYAQDWVVEAASAEEAESRVSNGDGTQFGSLRIIESRVDAYAAEEVSEEKYIECLKLNEDYPHDCDPVSIKEDEGKIALLKTEVELLGVKLEEAERRYKTQEAILDDYVEADRRAHGIEVE
jgi:hypothetical protein